MFSKMDHFPKTSGSSTHSLAKMVYYSVGLTIGIVFLGNLIMLFSLRSLNRSGHDIHALSSSRELLLDLRERLNRTYAAYMYTALDQESGSVDQTTLDRHVSMRDWYQNNKGEIAILYKPNGVDGFKALDQAMGEFLGQGDLLINDVKDRNFTTLKVRNSALLNDLLKMDKAITQQTEFLNEDARVYQEQLRTETNRSTWFLILFMMVSTGIGFGIATKVVKNSRKKLGRVASKIESSRRAIATSAKDLAAHKEGLVFTAQRTFEHATAAESLIGEAVASDRETHVRSQSMQNMLRQAYESTLQMKNEYADAVKSVADVHMFLSNLAETIIQMRERTAIKPQMAMEFDAETTRINELIAEAGRVNVQIEKSHESQAQRHNDLELIIKDIENTSRENLLVAERIERQAASVGDAAKSLGGTSKSLELFSGEKAGAVSEDTLPPNKVIPFRKKAS